MTAPNPFKDRKKRTVRWWQLTKACPNCDFLVDWTDARGPATEPPKVTCPECEAQVQVHDTHDVLPGEEASEWR